MFVCVFFDVLFIPTVCCFWLEEPIDLLEIDGKLYGFNGCHRYNAHKRLGLKTIEAKVRMVDKATLRLHLM